jgi:histidine triad (HIT) family protein
MDCIFCRIVAGSVPSFKVYEDTSTLAFMDINPLCEGHVLVIPKVHSANLWEIGEAALRDTTAAARLVAQGMKAALGLDSLHVVQSNGPWALQSVEHFHFHLVPRRENDGVPLDWGLTPGDRAQIKAAAARIASALPPRK